MSLKESLNYLNTLESFSSPETWRKFALRRIKTFLKYINNPQDKLSYIHIAGTSGKGGTAVILNSILTRAGFRTGLFTSPYLISPRESLIINNKEIKALEFSNLILNLKPKIEEFTLKENFGYPTSFEVILSAAFEYFAENNLDLVILEAGLGGKLDATNVIPSPLISILTKIDFDHTNLLGKSLKEIAREKAGIIKTKSICLSAEQKKEIKVIIEQNCLKKKVSFFYAGKNFNWQIKTLNSKGSIFSWEGFGKKYKNLKLSLIGEHQAENASLALACAGLLIKKSFFIPEKSIFKSLEKVKFPLRFEQVKKNPLIILDGAHNPHKIYALANTLKKVYPEKKIILIIGILADKDWKKIIKILACLSKVILCTSFKAGYNREVCKPRLLAKLAKKYSDKVEVILNHRLALKEAQKICQKG
ncbi:MAG: bifunctional folylpolyglutamate synthase/dihydrofolate synthase [Armatimonadetes bacterium]|nr:bifunctional folylpolyglutamate synthase/dihydrofolate synthase [Armatimonadota bacterium]